MQLITDPLHGTFFVNALMGGTLTALICALVGTWVVVRSMAFLGEAVSHGMLPGVAVAALLHVSPIIGAAASALVMSAGIAWASRRARLAQDTTIGIFFVIMLSVGVIIVSKSRSFATDLTQILFGDILAIDTSEIFILLGALALVAVLVALLHRPLTALALDRTLATSLRMRPAMAEAALTVLITVAVVASYRAVGSLLVVAMLVAPAATAALWARSIPTLMAWAALVGIVSVVAGLYISWYAGTAAGATIATTSGAVFLTTTALRPVLDRRRALPTPDTNGVSR
ncbi:metal ABC transporter permease [Schaalia sp. 19OD2882]|uniref:zinc ABC transporter permease AztB n=1 Tax=Schaalia sp. 19OD2882 TaxID=2794089 RepID=UPI001C1EA206|nr:zinc ABC transporter permease AztB [Schaalia sp. 19OD2882]QWW19892.1 metal ABC transporter permease [Schaalia sp. 19OD2882]